MIFDRWFAREAALSEADPADAGAIAALHAASFQRGWSEDEVERLLLDRSVVGHRAKIGRALAGFILSRVVEGEDPGRDESAVEPVRDRVRAERGGEEPGGADRLAAGEGEARKGARTGGGDGDPGE